jgi:translation initiation factor IF-2
MAEMNVSQFAKELGVQPALLLEQLQAAGVSRPLAENAPLTEQDKTQLLDYLRRVHGANESKGKITLTRKQTTEIKKADSTGRPRTIQVEVRKKRVFVKRDPSEAVPVADALWPPVGVRAPDAVALPDALVVAEPDAPPVLLPRPLPDPLPLPDAEAMGVREELAVRAPLALAEPVPGLVPIPRWMDLCGAVAGGAAAQSCVRGGATSAVTNGTAPSAHTAPWTTRTRSLRVPPGTMASADSNR